MNELRVCGGRQTPNYGFTTVNMGPTHGEFARFQPGPAIAMGYDDLKVIEAARFLTSIASDTEVGSTVADALAAARVLDAVAKAAESGQWVTVDAQVATVQ
jgi:predicted dehydrogenase